MNPKANLRGDPKMSPKVITLEKTTVKKKTDVDPTLAMAEGETKQRHDEKKDEDEKAFRKDDDGHQPSEVPNGEEAMFSPRNLKMMEMRTIKKTRATRMQTKTMTMREDSHGSLKLPKWHLMQV
jgi:hypothetical protein